MKIFKGVLEGLGLLFLILGVSAIDSEGVYMFIALGVAGLGCLLLYISPKIVTVRRPVLRLIKGGKHNVKQSHSYRTSY
ncbi:MULTISPECIES: hypothetical protein [Thermoanaerobacterium]|uniref:Uncharacterized protein n=3 Tax=Thermoanaerobacterium TaxID=28895 RepID=L0IQZ8_THETR|nr:MULTISPECIES: hypothetical protein [Thermoanaerobacterium]AFK94361.1 hypothetical protein Tsac_2814 [Thermoanaerobacterium saccharolyticum JW/SL-YS485]AGB20397.1 hypothetical protein Thethe_02846 [Thermoanaerobacterium thermosaccharolyticum M0795]ETO39131.1 hypothetical protein V518_0719 [Thermoanaerobacterium aotearoense SCUT27]